MSYDTDPTRDVSWHGKRLTVEELLAMLIDGRGTQEQRRAALRYLVSDDERIHLFAEAAVIQRQLEGEDEEARRAARRRRWRWIILLGGAIAGILAAAVLTWLAS